MSMRPGAIWRRAANKPIAAHLVVDDPERAGEWYAKVLDAQETSRIPLPDGGC